MRKLFFALFYATVWCWSAMPMESIERYNVILIHGADNSAGDIYNVLLAIPQGHLLTMAKKLDGVDGKVKINALNDVH